MSAHPVRRAVLTPNGRGAIAVVRVWGSGSVELVNRVFRPASGPPLDPARAGVIRFGRMGAGQGDEVVVVVVDGPIGPEVEIQGHGGPAAVGLVTDALDAAGALPATAELWADHAASTRLAAEAQADLSRAPTFRVAQVLLEQAQGALEGIVRAIVRQIEADPPAAIAPLEALRATAEVGLRLTRGWSVVLAGRPNVGKSRLLNALAGYERAIVSPTAGTTRDVVSLDLALDGWPVELSDTAGLRAATDAVESEGVERARDRQALADLVLLVLDRSEPLTAFDRDLIATHPDALIVANKADLPPAWEGADGLLAISAERGDGIDALTRAIIARLVPAPPDPGAGVVFRDRHVAVLDEAILLLRSGDVPEVANLIERELLVSGAMISRRTQGLGGTGGLPTSAG